jgi:hypothetical protein
MKTLIMICFAVVLVGCQAPRPQTEPLVFSGGDGSSHEQAVVIREARYRELGLLAEKLWLEQKYPGHRQTSQSVFNSDGRRYDLIEVATADGQTRKVYFDTTEFIEK